MERTVRTNEFPPFPPALGQEPRRIQVRECPSTVLRVQPHWAKALTAVDRLHERFPKSAVVHKIWLYCLPF